MVLLVAPALEPRLPIEGGEGAFRDDSGVLVMDEVSQVGDLLGILGVAAFNVRIWMMSPSDACLGPCRRRPELHLPT